MPDPASRPTPASNDRADTPATPDTPNDAAIAAVAAMYPGRDGTGDPCVDCGWTLRWRLTKPGYAFCINPECPKRGVDRTLYLQPPAPAQEESEREECIVGRWRFVQRDGRYVCMNEEGDAIVDANTPADAIRRILRCWAEADDARDRAEAKARAMREELREALQGVVDLYLSVVNSGDAGTWDPEEEDEIKRARATLTRTTETGK